MFVSSSEAAKAYSRLSTEELTLQGETLAVEMVGPTTALTESIYIGNLPTTETVVEDLTKMFSQYGLIEFLSMFYFLHRSRYTYNYSVLRLQDGYQELGLPLWYTKQCKLRKRPSKEALYSLFATESKDW